MFVRNFFKLGQRTQHSEIPVLVTKTYNMREMSSAPASSESFVLAPESSDKGFIIINRPKALNAINLDMVRKIYKHLKKFETCKSFVCIKGNGDKAFCAGGDVRTVTENNLSEDSKNFFREEYTTNALISNYNIPYIALMDGVTMGGGVGLSVHGKYRIATERTLLAMPETAIGLFPDVGSSHFLPKLDGKLGLYMGLTGHRLRGDDVFKAGFATHYCESSKLSELEACLLNCTDADDIPEILQRFHMPTKKDFSLNPLKDQINHCFTAKCMEEIIENLKRDGTEWAQKTLAALAQMSPTSLKVTFRELEMGAQMSLPQCLKMEFRLAYHSLEDSDFKEGVRALLVDKDKKPKWNPTKLEEVTDERVDWFFKKLPDTEELKL